jgi:hypothetical protein
MISQETFNQIELEHNCGYWNVCWEHACPCAITTENKGLRQDIWDDFKKEQRELAEEFDNDDCDYEPMARCDMCGCWEYESDLIDGLCFDCYEDDEEDPFEDDDLGCFDCNEDCENYDSCMEPNS